MLKKHFGISVNRTFDSNLERAFAYNPWIYTSFDFDLVLDVGANAGQFAEIVLKYLDSAPIVCFEPLAMEFVKLTSKFVSNPRVELSNLALGSVRERKLINVHSKSTTSSFLGTSISAGEYVSSLIEKKEVQVDTLSNQLANRQFENALLKIDVQGFELEVLKGAAQVLDKISMVIVECSYVELYEGEPLFDEIYQYLIHRNFSYLGEISTMMGSSRVSRPVQADGVFVNKTFKLENMIGDDK
jgi:FkbM family methyltransferase